MAKNFVFPISTTNEIASGQSSGDLNTFRVHQARKGEWTVKKWVYFSSYKNSKILSHLVAIIFVFPTSTSTTNEIASGQSSGHFGKSVVLRVQTPE